jgi:predicted metalloprotease with PDZ domain
VLADVSGDAAFAADFFARYVQGHDVVDLGPLVERAGFSWRPPVEGRGFAGLVRMQDAPGGALVTGAVPFGTAAFEAGLARDDLIVNLAGRPVNRSADVVQTLQSSRAGDVLPIVFERQGRRIESTLRMRPDPRRQLVPLEDRGASPDDSQRRFREAWLGPSAVRAGLGARLEGELTRCGAAPCR